jgi:hypothetical protein
MEKGITEVAVAAFVPMPLQEGSAKRIPPCPSGICELREGGRTAATATSKLTLSFLSVFETRSWGERE